jgi:catechol 2,3-dioxygenase-like lactoylglutathione lyase family enzyme
LSIPRSGQACCFPELAKERPITVTFNHTIIAAKNRNESAKFFRELLEVPEASSWGVFTNIQLDEGVLLQFAEPPVKEIQMQHYAFLLDDDLFDRAYARIQEWGVEHWADPQGKRPGQINTEHGGRGVYFMDPAGHGIELITRPYL